MYCNIKYYVNAIITIICNIYYCDVDVLRATYINMERKKGSEDVRHTKVMSGTEPTTRSVGRSRQYSEIAWYVGPKHRSCEQSSTKLFEQVRLSVRTKKVSLGQNPH